MSSKFGLDKFNALALREQILIAAAFGLVVFLGVWQFVVIPINQNRVEAQRNYVGAKRDLDIVRVGLPTLAASTKKRSAKAFHQSAVIDTAKATGLTISRMQSQEDGRLQVWFENAPSIGVFSFLEQISQNYAVEISRMTISRQESGGVRAQCTLSPIL